MNLDELSVPDLFKRLFTVDVTLEARAEERRQILEEIKRRVAASKAEKDGVPTP